MLLVKSRSGLYEEEQIFECVACGARIELPSAGSIGLYLWVWAIVSAFIIWLFLWDAPYAGWITYCVVGLGVGLGGFVGLSNLMTHIENPLIVLPTKTPIKILTKPAGKTLFSHVLNLGLVKTPLVVGGAIVVFLAGAALIGYVKDYVL